MKKAGILLGFLGGVVALFYATGLHNYFTLNSLQTHQEWLQNLQATHPVLFPTAFATAYALLVAFSLPAATLLTLLAGFLFGPIFGTILVALSATLGATTLFLVARSTFGALLRQRAGSFYKKIESDMAHNAVGYLLFMRLVPLFPFALVNIVPAFFNVKLSTYFFTTFFGILPGTFVYVNLGQALATISSLADLASPQTLGAVSLLGIFALVPILVKKMRKKNDTKA